jgi:hypothetical protein
MINAEQDLIARGQAAIPMLSSFFTGEAKNCFGVPYRILGLPLDCAIIVAGQLGPLAKPLESQLRDELRRGHRYAPGALRRIGSLEDESILVLAKCLDGDWDLSFESAATLIHYRCAGHSEVLKVTSSSKRAAYVLERVTRLNVPKTEPNQAPERTRGTGADLFSKVAGRVWLSFYVRYGISPSDLRTHLGRLLCVRHEENKHSFR